MQEERQRSRERAESEADCANSGHEDMPVERILEAELAVEPKTESYGDMNLENSVCGLRRPSTSHILGVLETGKGCIQVLESWNPPLRVLWVFSFFLFFLDK